MAKTNWIWPRQIEYGQDKLNMAKTNWIWPRQIEYGQDKLNMAKTNWIWPRQIEYGQDKLNMVRQLYSRVTMEVDIQLIWFIYQELL